MEHTEGFPGPPTASEGQDRAGALGWGRRPNRPKTSLANRTITPSPLNVVNVHCSVFKAQERGKARAGARFVGELRPYERSRCDEHGRVAAVRHVACARPTGGSLKRRY